MSSEQVKPAVAPVPMRPPMAAQSQQSAITPADIIRILQTRMWMIIGITIAFSILFVGLFFVLLKTSPQYTSEAYVECRMPSSIGSWGVTQMLPRKEIIAMETAQVSALLNSDAFIGSVIANRREIQRSDWAGKIPPDKREKTLKDNFSASPIRDTAYLKLAFKASTPGDAEMVLNEILGHFERNMETQANSSLDNTLKSLRTSESSLETKLSEIKGNMRALAGKSNIPPGWRGGGNTVINNEIMLYNEEMIRLEAVINQLNKEYDLLVQQQKDNNGMLDQVAIAMESDPVIVGLNNQIMTMEQELARLMGSFGEKHREVTELKDRISAAERQLVAHEEKMTTNYTSQALSSVQRDIQVYTTQLEEATRAYNAAASDQRDLDKDATLYQDLMLESEALTEQLNGVKIKIDDILVQKESRDNIRAFVQQPANKPNEISFPRLPMFVVGGVVLGLMTGGGLAFLLELLNDTVRTPTDIRRYLSVPLLGLVPEYEEDDIDDLAKILLTRPTSITSEFIRQVRTNLKFSAPAEELKTILVTSCQAESGKTTMASCLAISLAQDNKKVLLIDANFYRPAISKLYPGGSPEGLSNYLIAQNEIDDIVHKTDVENLSVIYSGPKPPNPTGLFSSDRMAEILKTQREIYDYVIIDGPPSLVVLDAKVISSVVDGTIPVVLAEEDSRGMAGRMIRELKQMKANIVGVLLNGVVSRKGGYFKKAFKTYQDYVESGS